MDGVATTERKIRSRQQRHTIYTNLFYIHIGGERGEVASPPILTYIIILRGHRKTRDVKDVNDR